MEIKIHAALPVKLCASLSYTEHNMLVGGFLQMNNFTKHSKYFFPPKIKYMKKIKAKISSLYFFLFIYILIVFLTKLYWHFLEPKLANKYNEMLKRTIGFQIQYSSQKKKNVCDQEMLCSSSAGHNWQEHEVTFPKRSEAMRPLQVILELRQQDLLK